jgi:pimeloyl-ACP methyl ester carboxylesterase
LQAKDPKDAQITAIATAVFNSAIPYSKRKDGWENDTEQWETLSELPLASIRCLTLILQGTVDQNVPFAQGEFAHAQIAGSRFVPLAGQDHWMLITKYKELGKIVDAFLLEHASSDSARQAQPAAQR